MESPVRGIGRSDSPVRRGSNAGGVGGGSRDPDDILMRAKAHLGRDDETWERLNRESPGRESTPFKEAMMRFDSPSITAAAAAAATATAVASPISSPMMLRRNPKSPKRQAPEPPSPIKPKIFESAAESKSTASRALLKELDAGGTLPMPNNPVENAARTPTHICQHQWTPSTPIATPTKREPDNRATPIKISSPAKTNSSSSPRDQLMEWQWSVHGKIPLNGAGMQFRPPAPPTPASTPRKSDVSLDPVSGFNQRRGSDSPTRDSALGSSYPDDEFGMEKSEVTIDTPTTPINGPTTPLIAPTAPITTPTKTGIVKAALGKLNIFDRFDQKKTDPLLPKPYPRPTLEVRPLTVDPPSVDLSAMNAKRDSNCDQKMATEIYGKESAVPKTTPSAMPSATPTAMPSSTPSDARSSSPHQKVFVSACLNRSNPRNMVLSPVPIKELPEIVPVSETKKGENEVKECKSASGRARELLQNDSGKEWMVACGWSQM